MALIRKKALIIGDHSSGKTSLSITYSTNKFPQEFVPSIQDYVCEIQVNDACVSLGLFDTAGHRKHDRLRPLGYPNTDVVLLMFAIDCPESFFNVSDRWIFEMNQYCSNIPIVLVGNKLDLRTDEKTLFELQKIKQKPITFEEGRLMAEKINAFTYLECSAKTNVGVKTVFETAATATLNFK